VTLTVNIKKQKYSVIPLLHFVRNKVDSNSSKVLHNDESWLTCAKQLESLVDMQLFKE